MDRRELVSEIVDAGYTMDFMRAFGWQGGTVHQVADELVRRNYHGDIHEKLLSAQGHRCTSDCRREGCEKVWSWQRRAEAE